ncbi:MAG: arginase family protein [Bacteroidales bacterium]|nr:arginase family protein [Bacteroidales bacterium]HPD95316.1 arginase family protein [Tenuifilaceae bacterium]HRX31576.1 arginase family protein [Tenuifilaceae bacterium]
MNDILSLFTPPSAKTKPAGFGIEDSLNLQIVNPHALKDFKPGSKDVLLFSAREQSLFREYLYALAGIKMKGTIFDLGILIPSKSQSDAYQTFQSVCELLAQTNAAIVFIGSSHELTYYAYEGFKSTENLLSLSIIDSKIDVNSDVTDFHSENFINKLLNEKVESLLNLSVIGFQTYLTGNSAINQITKKHHELYRLGNIRSGYFDVEPALRNSQILSFDLSAIRNSDYPANEYPTPNGLYAEEACQLCRFAGGGEKNRFLGLFECKHEKDTVSTMLTAQLVWHYIDGFAQRKIKNPLQNPSLFKKFIVNTGTPEVDMNFYSDELTNRWWFEFPISSKKVKQKNMVFPCSQADYIVASRGDVPDRWLNFFEKIQKL